MKSVVPINREEQETLDEVTARLGSEPLARELLLRAGIRAYQALGPALLVESEVVHETRADYEPATDVPGLDVLRKQLASQGIIVNSARPGRPTTLTITSQKRMELCGVESPEWRVPLGPERRVVASLNRASQRNSGGGAAFGVGSYGKNPPQDAGEAARADLFFFVLEDEARVWVASRRMLQDIYRRLKAGRRVARFALLHRGQSLRVTLPKKRISMDLDMSVEVVE